MIPDEPGGLVRLFDNNGNDSGAGVSSQNFEAQYDAFDDLAADDFRVPAGHVWSVRRVIVSGVHYQGPGPADSENVHFYTSKKKLPNALEKQFLGVVGSDSGGSFNIRLPSSVRLSGGPSDGAGKVYWLSVQATQDFSSAGQWLWEGALNDAGDADAWENPGDGFGTGCTSWADERACIGDFGQGPSKMFKLRGVDLVQ